MAAAELFWPAAALIRNREGRRNDPDLKQLLDRVEEPLSNAESWPMARLLLGNKIDRRIVMTVSPCALTAVPN
jgi:hypothetical protein